MRKLTKKRIRSNKRQSRKNRRQSKMYRRKTRTYKKGGDDFDKVNCCMCGKEVNITNTLIPRECLNKYGRKAHRICERCWWNPKTGFAREGISHGCPGCAKNLPLTKVQIKEPEFVDLTLDDD